VHLKCEKPAAITYTNIIDKNIETPMFVSDAVECSFNGGCIRNIELQWRG
jgi:hypothetical protein